MVQRVHSLHMLQGELRSALLAHPGLVPLPASFDVDIAPITGSLTLHNRCRFTDSGSYNTTAKSVLQTI